VTGFLDRLLAQTAGAAAGLEPRPRYRFADRPAFASDPPASDPPGATDPLQAGFVFEHAEAADRGVAQLVDVALLPFETSHETGGGSRLPDEAEAVPAAGAPLPLGPQFGQRSAASRRAATDPGPSSPRELPSDAEIAGRSGRAPRDGSDDDGLLMPVGEAASSGGWPCAEDAGAPSPSGEYGDSGLDEGRVVTRRGRDASGRFSSDTAMRERRFAAGTVPPIFVARGMAAAEEVPTVVVRIGRIDVRAMHASTPAVTPKSRLQTPSLDAYLRGRDRRGR
jgi:hypothetical protein